MDVTDEIKSRLDIVSFIGNYVPLKKSGRNFKALCPFHTEKTPSFVVFPESQQWRCFGACGEGGDIFSFVMKHEGWDFSDALRFLADQAGVELKPLSSQQVEDRERVERLRGMLAETASFYHQQLLNSAHADFARSYVENRALSQETVENFMLGYAPDKWDATSSMLLAQGYNEQDMIAGGLLVMRDDGRTYDRFRNRLMIPIFDIRSNIVGFGARALAPDAKPKYLNSPQSDVFDKSRLLYGLSHARRSIRETETAVIVEGYMDVLQAHQHGFSNVIAEMGTALTESQLTLLSRYANQLILSLDPDAAGQMATERGREVIERVSRSAAQQVGDEGMWDFDAAEREHRAVLTTEFDSQGMLSYESRMGFDIRVLSLPSGQDPDELIRHNSELWEALIDEALPIVEYTIRRTIEGRDMDDPKVKAWVAQQIKPLIDNVADAVERSHYTQRLARLLKIPENTLFPPKTSRPSRSTKSAQSAAQSLPKPAVLQNSRTDSIASETFCLAALLSYPNMQYQVNRVFAKYLSPEMGSSEGGAAQDILAWYLTPKDFSSLRNRRIYELWMQALEQDGEEPIEWLVNQLADDEARVVDRWLGQPLYALLRDVSVDDVELSYEKIFEEVVRRVLNLRWARLEERSQELIYLLQDADNGGDAVAAEEYGLPLNALITGKRQVAKAQREYDNRNKIAGKNN